MSLSRRGVTVAWRLRALCAPAGQCDLGSIGEAFAASSTTAASSPELHALFPSSHRTRNSSNSNSYGHFSSRNFSIFPGSSSSTKNEDSGGGDLSSSSSATTSGGVLDAGEPAAATITTTANAIDSSSFAAYTPESIIDVAALAETAALDAASEGCWAPTRALQWLIENVHETTGLPWWSSIMLTTVGIRAASFPIMLMQIKNTYRLSQARPEVEALVEHLKEEQARGNPTAVGDYQSQVAAVWSKYNANPLKSVATLIIQAPMFIGFFSALRGMAAAKVPSLVEGGAFWFPDLTIADPSYALPVLASCTFLLTIEAGAADGMEGQPDKMKQKMKNIMRVVALIVVPFSANLPASVFMYWTASNLFSLCQTLVLKNKAVKRVLGVPDLSKMGAKPGSEPGKPFTTFTQKPKPVAPVTTVAATAVAAAAPVAATSHPPLKKIKAKSMKKRKNNKQH